MSRIKITTRFDKDSLRLGATEHLKHRHKWFNRSRYLYLVVFIALGIFMLIKGDLPFGFTFLTLAPLLFIRRYFWIHRLIGKANSSPHYEQNLSWVFTDTDIEQSAQDLHSKFAWTSLYETVVAEKAILLYPQKGIFYTLPRRDFSSDADFLSLAKLSQEKAPKR